MNGTLRDVLDGYLDLRFRMNPVEAKRYSARKSMVRWMTYSPSAAYT